MVATIIAVIKTKGILATYWEFDFTVGNCQTLAIEGTVSFDDLTKRWRFPNAPNSVQLQ
ncbi:hypothetical protein [Caballeronia sordidicola]|uniref:Uncharacterized protein n=1 Tax=Caballeronia sordidicola TaxID=196367 RepID=A0A242N427_CABSO|nr:hypothetical protein [Caballeronia sordidicola]OTP78420.1 hypothetical protein PAMC26577_04980 [Caballeronia sordidicola]